MISELIYEPDKISMTYSELNVTVNYMNIYKCWQQTFLNNKTVFQNVYILQYCCYCTLDQINWALVSMRDFFQKHYKS